jgi:hypothetical protein
MQLIESGILMSFTLLSPGGWFTIFGYIGLCSFIFLVSRICYILLQALSEGKAIVTILVYPIICLVIAIGSLFISAILLEIIPLQLILKRPTYEYSFISVWIGVTVLTISVLILPVLLFIDLKFSSIRQGVKKWWWRNP